MSILVIHQPNLFPNIKLLQKICLGSEWLIMDDVQYERREVQNRIKIRKLESPGYSKWLTASIKKNDYNAKIKDIYFSDFMDFKRKTYNLIFDYYHKSDYYEFILFYLDKCFSKSYNKILDFNVHSMITLFEMLKIKIKYDYSSNYKINTFSTERLVDLCKIKGYDKYLSGLGGRNYIDSNLFEYNEISLLWHPWLEPKVNDNLSWDQISFIDFVARYGPEKLKEYLMKGEMIYE